MFTAPGPGWPDFKKVFLLGRTGETEVRGDFGLAAARIQSVPAGLGFELTNAHGLSVRGLTPADLPRLPAGPVTLRVSRPGWPDVVQNQVLEASLSKELVAEFVAGQLAVTSEPSGATILLGSQQAGVTPRTFEDLAPGKYDLKLQLKGYLTTDVSSVVNAGLTTAVTTRLQADPPPEPGKGFAIREIGLILNPIVAGKLQMGSPAAGGGYDKDETPSTSVTFTRPFWMGRYEVSQEQWLALMPENRSQNKGSKLPVENVTWLEAREYCRKLTEREREAGRLPDGYVYTLPTEAQWEYACRAGNYGPANFSYPDVAWYSDNSAGQSHPVGQKQPNDWGLYDMRGNVGEWCLDWYNNALPGGSVIDWAGPDLGTARVTRGGNFGTDANQCRAAFRNYLTPTVGKPNIGFRVALSPVR
jgi:hypothetical protein